MRIEGKNEKNAAAGRPAVAGWLVGLLAAAGCGWSVSLGGCRIAIEAGNKGKDRRMEGWIRRRRWYML